jgi:hypothetical protein
MKRILLKYRKSLLVISFLLTVSVFAYADFEKMETRIEKNKQAMQTGSINPGETETELGGSTPVGDSVGFILLLSLSYGGIVLYRKWSFNDNG